MSKKFDLFRFCKSQDGTIAIFWAMSLVTFIGFTAIIVDIGRHSASQSELQSFADSVALAAAGELDGTSTAITRATTAASSLVSDTQTFASGVAALSGSGDYTLTFHETIPANDASPMGVATTDPAKAKFAYVVVTPRNLTYSLTSALERMLGNTGTITVAVSAEAVAGFTIAACDISPLMFCLPPSWETTLGVGDLIQLRSGGNGAAWGPGNFGFIDLAAFEDTSGVCADEGGNKLACLIAAQSNLTKCVLTNGIDTEPGQKVGITNAAFNVRFDIYRAVLNGEKNNPDFSPAPNVIKGIKKNGGGNACIQGSEVPTVDTMAVPRDTCMGSASCGGNNRFGDGTWDRQGYLNVNHDLADGTDDDLGSDAHLPSLSAANSSFAGTRYGMYLREIAYGDTLPFSNPNADAILDPTLEEHGRPQCSNQMSNNPARRIVVAAGVNCTANPVQGSTTGVPVARFVQVFLTEPVGEDGTSPPGFDIYGEVVGFPDVSGGSAPGASGIFRDVVQLYR